MRGSPKCRALRNMPGLLSSLFSIISPLKPSVLDEPFEDGHLDVETVLRLVEDGGSRPLDHLVRDLLAPVGGEAMHHDRPAIRLPQPRRVDAIPLEGGAPLPALGLLPHAGPDVGVEHVRVPRRFRRSADDPDVPPADPSRPHAAPFPGGGRIGPRDPPRRFHVAPERIRERISRSERSRIRSRSFFTISVPPPAGRPSGSPAPGRSPRPGWGGGG